MFKRKAFISVDTLKTGKLNHPIGSVYISEIPEKGDVIKLPVQLSKGPLNALKVTSVGYASIYGEFVFKVRGYYIMPRHAKVTGSRVLDNSGFIGKSKQTESEVLQ